MPPSETPTKPTWNAKTVALCTVVAIGLLFSIPLVVALITWWFVKGRMRRIEAAILAVTSALVIVMATQSTVLNYLNWVGNAATGDIGFPPLFGIAVQAAFLVALIELLMPTRLGTVVKTKLKIKERDPDDIMASDAEVERLSVVQPSTDQMVTPVHSSARKGNKRAFPIALGRDGSPVMISEDEIKTHAVVLGTTGSGKTVTLETMFAGLSDLGWSVVMLDLKEDTAMGGLRDYMSNYALSHGLNYQEVALSNPNPSYWFNPLAGMAPDEAINAILALQDFDDGHWQAIGRTLVGQLVTLFYDAYKADPARFPEPNMYDIGQVFLQPEIKMACEERIKCVLTARPDRGRQDFITLIKPGEDHRKAAAGLGSRIVNMYESDAGRKVLRPGANRETMDVTRGGVCYVGLNTLGLSELARVVSTATLLRLSAWAGARTTGAAEVDTSTRIAVIIDEANWIDRKEVQNLLSRARSAGITVILATQGPQDWNDENGNDWNKVVNNVNVGIIMRQGTEEAAEMCADFIGLREKRTLLAQMRDGEETTSGTVRESLDHVVPTNKIRDLKQGHAVLKIASPDKRIEWLKINLRPSGAILDTDL